EPVMTPQEFQAYANWPGNRPHFGEGMDAGADAGADDEEADEAAANAFIDEGDDGDASD
ncbi:hypothetical protein A2U01_0057516, partial [Trifolium medium]|nr:hypothetical protein [Trifolium medium]